MPNFIVIPLANESTNKITYLLYQLLLYTFPSQPLSLILLTAPTLCYYLSGLPFAAIFWRLLQMRFSAGSREQIA